MTRIPFLLTLIVLGLALVFAGEARAQDSKAVVQPPGVVGELGQTSPDALIASQLWLAEVYEREGQADAAIRAYEAALLSILQFRGQGHLSMVAPMVRVARLTQDPATRMRWLATALRIAASSWDAKARRLPG
ncbi:hypothetical protein [Brevundimonas sp.]|uniref:hypothetical protein n=1 Tax=Brevundimonas sp. TaxID=1871086 RepID=UPI001D8E45A2|nr:hypothetical protein [Brevundimonas sp.]MBL0948423.1 hypothetical protein [Brevundimonas sp.]